MSIELFSDRPVPSEFKNLKSYEKARDAWLARHPMACSAEEFLSERDNHKKTPKRILKEAFK